jgi:G3E family GTPase
VSALPPEPIGVSILSGFLGSGKTTLLNALLQAPHGRRLAVIMNEFGEMGVDGALVSGGEQFALLDNGCLCCALNEDLQRTLHDLLQRGGFDHLVVETTGLADPLPVARTFDKPGLAAAFRVDAVVTVVDSLNLEAALQQAPEAQAQLEGADVLVINKVDLAADAGAAAAALCRQHNDLAPLFFCSRGEGLPWAFLLAVPEAAAKPTAPVGAHAHGASSFSTWSFVSAAPFDELRLEDLLAELPESVWRIKGIVHTNAPWDLSLVHAVAGRMEVRPFAALPERCALGLVFIGPQLQPAALEAACRRALA